MTARHARNDRARRAFTLIELVLAMGITMLVMFVAAYAINTTAGVASRADARMEVLTTGRTGLELLDADVTGAQIDSEGNIFRISNGTYNYTLLSGTTVSYDADTLVLTCTPSEAYVDLDGDGLPDEARTVRCYYFLADTALVRYDLPADSELPSPLTPALTQGKTLMFGVRSFDVQPYDANAPTDEPGWVPDPVAPYTYQWDTVYDWDEDGSRDDITDTAARMPTAPQVRQYRRLPQFVRVTLQVQDSQGYMRNREDDTTFELVRLMEVGTAAPAQ